MESAAGLLTRGSLFAAFPASRPVAFRGEHLPSQRRDRPGLAPGSLTALRMCRRAYHSTMSAPAVPAHRSALGVWLPVAVWAALIFAFSSIPSLSTVAVLMNPGHPGHPDYLKSIQAVARDTVRILPIRVANVGQIEAAFDVIKQERAEALIVPGDGLFFSQARRIAELAVQQRLPTMFSTREPVQAGALMSYGPNLAEQFYRSDLRRQDPQRRASR